MSDDVRFGKFRFDRDAGVLYRQAELVQVPPRALAVLGCLIAANGDVVTKEQILETAWPDSFVAEDSLTHAISVLRSALGDNPRKPEFIQTVPRRGYRFVATLPAGHGAPSAAADTASHLATRPWILVAGVAALILLLVAAGVGMRGAADDLRAGSLRQMALVVEAAAGVQFDMAETRAALKEQLESATRLVVTTAADADKAILSVTFASIGERVQIVATVRATEDDRRWWRQRWNMPAGLYAADRFAASLVSRLRFLLDVVHADSAVRGSANVDAMIMAVHGADLLMGEAQQDLLLSLDAAAELRRAFELDPRFTRARAGEIAVVIEAEEWRNPTPQEFEDAEKDIARALETDADDPVVHIAAALLARRRGDHAEWAAALDEALRLAPSLFWIYMSRAELEHEMGQDEVALTTANRGVAHDPYLPSMLGRLIDVQLWLGDPDASEETLSTLAAIDVTEDGKGGYWSGRSRFRILIARGDMVAAEAELLALREVWANAQWIHLMEAAFYDEQGNAEAAAAARARLELLRRE